MSTADDPAGEPTVDWAETERWVPTSDGHELHLRQVRPGADDGGAPGVLFLPGLFADGGFFLGRSGQGPAKAFLDEGFTAYVASLRGHGPSRWPERRAYDWNFDTYVRHDVPDLIRAVSAAHDGPLFVLAHSMVGYAALAALGVEPDLQKRLAGVATVSSAVNDYSDGGLSKRAQMTFSSVISRLVGRFPARALKQGRCDEPPGLMRQFAAWAPSGAFRSADGATDYWQALGQVTLPVLVGIGAGDTFHASPARARKLADHLGGGAEFTLLGRETGLSWDPGHVDVIRGARAQEQVLPRLVAWMRGTAPAGDARGGATDDTTTDDTTKE
ncbi:alpha/beta fold hydrolase [Streptomyces sp. NPDC059679]|uniref:alpha/beta fold hydrolase n=1 Tax=Streptomyces sp. NPDC059679 TaxID=3346903 RepID=UPI003699A805